MKLTLYRYLYRTAIIIIFGLFFSATCNKDDENPVFPPDSGFDLIATYNTPGTANSVLLKRILFNNYVFIADGNSGISIVNVNMPSSPTLTGSYNTQGYASDVLADSVGNLFYAFVADGTNGLLLLSLNNLSSPQLLFTINFPGDAVKSLYFSKPQNLLYAGSYNGNLKIYDASGLPYSFEEIGSAVLFNTITSILVKDTLCYVSEPDYGIEVFNVVNPSIPGRIGYFDSPGEPEDFWLLNNKILIADGIAGITIADVSNPANITYLASVKTEDYPKRLFVTNNNLYITEGVYGLESFNITNPLSPDRTGAYNSSGIPYGLWVHNNEYLYLADGNNGLVILKIR